MLTTIQIPEGLRRRLKVLAAHRGSSYMELLEDLVDLYEALIPFKSGEEFRAWFERNLGRFGFKKILGKKPKPPTYVLEAEDGRVVKAAVELSAKDFLRSGRDPTRVDLIVCAFSPKGSPAQTLPLLRFEEPQELLRRLEGKTASLAIPAALHRRLEKAIEGTGFASPSAYVTFILREILAEKEMEEKGEISKEDEEKVKARLKALGYL